VAIAGGTIIAAVVLLAWLIPLIVGVKLLRGPQRTGGLVLVVIGILWGVPSLFGLVTGLIFYTTARSQYGAREFDAANYRGHTGILQVAHKGPSRLVARSSEGSPRTQYSSTDGRFTMPSGNHLVDEFTAVAQAENGRKWEATTRFGRARPVTLAKGNPAVMQVGPPYTVQVAIQSYGSSETFSLEIRDSSGTDVRLTELGAAAKPPTFEVLDTTGKVLFSGKFAFG
jgi:hypothetical protein